MGFRLILDAEPDIEVVGEAGDGATGVGMAGALHPDVVLMDVRMPSMDGIQATGAIVAAGSATKVLILTTFDLDQYVFAGLQAGASGFLLKDAPPAELLAAIRTVAGGDAVLAPTATRRLIDQFVPLMPDPNQPSPREEVLNELTGRERSVFGLLAAGRSNREIATELHVSEGTVRSCSPTSPASSPPVAERPLRSYRSHSQGLSATAGSFVLWRRVTTLVTTTAATIARKMYQA
jgi:DNA-binding NarL/FixJ family response regulator